MYYYNSLFLYNDIVGGTSVPPNLLRTSSSTSTKSSTEASTGAFEGRGLGTQYSWNPTATAAKKASEKRLNEDASKNCIIVVVVL